MILVTWNSNPQDEPIIRGWLKYYDENDLMYSSAILPKNIHKRATLKKYLKFIKALFFRKYSVMLCNDVYSAFLSLVVGKIRRTKIIYNVQELYSEFIPWDRQSRIKRRFILIREYFLYNYSSVLVFPNNARADYVKSKYSTSKSKFIILENIPTYLANSELDFDSGKCIVYSGTITENRPINILGPLSVYVRNYGIKVVLLTPTHAEVDKLIKNYSNIHHIDYLDPSQYISFLKNCFLGIGIYNNKDLNNKFCAPVKFYDFLQAKLPFVMVDNPTICDLEKEFKGVFELFDLNSYESLENSVKKIILDYELYKGNISQISPDRINFKKYYSVLDEIHGN